METSRLHSDNPSALPAGTRLGEFELIKLLGVGGFGIVYLAFDHALEREVAVKEYMPASLAGRTETMHVSLRSQSDAETFALGLKSFINEARLLARFDHPSLLKVHRFWEANGTAYMAMPVMRGRTVKEIRLEMAGPPDEAWLRSLLDPLLSAIERLHSEGVYHRDIAPDNIQLEPGGRPVLLDFGAARRVIGDKSQTLTAILKPAYAPIEQYGEAGSVKQGPWTDFYALGATLHFLLLARPPAPATARAIADEASQLTPEALPGCSEVFLHMLDWMLAPRPADRPQNVAALREVLEGRAMPPRRLDAPPSQDQWDRTVILPPSRSAPKGPPSGEVDQEATLVMPPPAPRAEAQPASLPETRREGSTVKPPATPEAPPFAALAEPARTTAAPPSGDSFSAPPVSTAFEPPPAGPAKSKMVPVALAVIVVAAAAAAAAMFWPRTPAAPTAAIDLPAPAVVAAASAADAPLPPMPAAPESTVATVVLPGGNAAATGAAQPLQATAPSNVAATPSSSNVKPAAPVSAGNTAAKPPAAHRPGTAPSAGAPNTGSTSTAAIPAPSQANEAKPPAPTAPAAQPAPQPTLPATTTAQPDPVKPQSPEQRCGTRGGLSYFVCMERECLRSEFSGHADCQKWRQSAKRE